MNERVILIYLIIYTVAIRAHPPAYNPNRSLADARVRAQKLVVVVPLAAPVQAAVCIVRPEMTAVIAAVRPGSAVPPGRRIQAARGQAERLEARRDCPLDGHANSGAKRTRVR